MLHSEFQNSVNHQLYSVMKCPWLRKVGKATGKHSNMSIPGFLLEMFCVLFHYSCSSGVPELEPHFFSRFLRIYTWLCHCSCRCPCCFSRYCLLGMVIPPLTGNPYNGYINPYFWVDDHPPITWKHGSLDPSTHDRIPKPSCWFMCMSTGFEASPRSYL